MQPDVVSRAEHLPFDDGSFDAVVSRVAHHHFDDRSRLDEMARVSGSRRRRRQLFMSDEAEEADKLRDPSHVRNYTEDEWRACSRTRASTSRRSSTSTSRSSSAVARPLSAARARRRSRARAARRPDRGRLGHASSDRAEGAKR
jgi:SAM-dependent methyltransferase